MSIGHAIEAIVLAVAVAVGLHSIGVQIHSGLDAIASAHRYAAAVEDIKETRLSSGCLRETDNFQ